MGPRPALPPVLIPSAALATVGILALETPVLPSTIARTDTTAVPTAPQSVLTWVLQPLAAPVCLVTMAQAPHVPPSITVLV